MSLDTRIDQSCAKQEVSPAGAIAPSSGTLSAALSPLNMGLLILAVALACYFGFRWSFLLEDAFISLRYSKNLYLGFGPVYNRGELPVEGYTNFLWMALMSAHFFVTDHPEHLLLYYNRLFGILVVAAVWWELLARSGPGRQWVWLGIGMVASHQTLHSWMAGGLETHFFAFLITAAIGRFLREEFTPHLAQKPLSCWIMSLALLTRPEAYFLGLLCGACMIWRRLIRADGAPGGWLRVFIWGGVCALLGGGHLLWRHSYYGDWLPNTFYAKMSGAYFESGIPYVKIFYDANYLHWGVIASIIGANVLLAYPMRKNPLLGQSLFLSVAISAFTVYMAYAGGDVFEFRLLTPVVPLIGLLVPITFAGIVEGFTRYRRIGVFLGMLFAIGGAGLIMRSLYTADRRPYEETLRTSVSKAACVRYMQGWDFATNWTPLGLWFREYAKPTDRLALGAAGVVPYYSEIPVLDFLGLNDRFVARMPLETRGGIGHERMAPREYMLEQKVTYVWDDIFFQTRPQDFPQAALAENKNIFVMMYSGLWARIETLEPPDPGVRQMLRDAGAIVHPGPFEDMAPADKSNFENWPDFLKRAKNYGYDPAPFLPLFEHSSGSEPGVIPLGRFESSTWGDWTVEGDAFGTGPSAGRQGNQMPVEGFVGAGLANSFRAELGDVAKGRLLSRTFVAVEKMSLGLRVGGGVEGVGVALLESGQRVHIWKGIGSEYLVNQSLDLTPWAGKTLQVEIFDESEGSWGHIVADEIVLYLPEGISADSVMPAQADATASEAPPTDAALTDQPTTATETAEQPAPEAAPDEAESSDAALAEPVAPSEPPSLESAPATP